MSLELAIAELFQKKGRTSLPERDFVFAASLDYRWFSPKDAQRFLDRSIEYGLLMRDDSGMLKPSFDYHSYSVPPGYKPSIDILDEAKASKGHLKDLLEAVCSATGKEKEALMDEVREKEKNLGLDVEVAMVLVASENDLNIEEYLPGIKAGLKHRYRPD